MHDLRKQVLLESGKTVSRKARSKETTPPISRGNSATTSPRNRSRIGSSQASDDDDDSDETEWSVASIDALEALEEPELEGDSAAWEAALDERISALVDRKRSATEGREQMMSGIVTILTRHFAQKELRPKVDELLRVLQKSVKAGQSEREVVLALKLLALVLITEPSETVYDAIEGSIKTIIEDSQYPAAKVVAIHSLGIATFYGGATVDETQSVMDLFLDIVSSDGAVIGEEDNASVVVASLEEWGFLATQLDDLEDLTEPAMDAFVDQLESTDARVQVAAGDNIALLYEKSYTEAESDDEPEDTDEPDAGGARMVKRYTVYRQHHHLKQVLADLAKVSSKRISKKDRKILHVKFNDVLTTLEKPARGPRYSTTTDIDGIERGSRMKIAISGGGKMTIDKWWKLHRLNGLKRLLRSGFMVHYEFNQTVFDSLPVMVEDY